jgi:hypothetical protein
MSDKEAKTIVKAIIADLCNRRGLRQEWEGIDDDIQREIRNEWIKIVKQGGGRT